MTLPEAKDISALPKAKDADARGQPVPLEDAGTYARIQRDIDYWECEGLVRRRTKVWNKRKRKFRRTGPWEVRYCWALRRRDQPERPCPCCGSTFPPPPWAGPAEYASTPLLYIAAANYVRQHGLKLPPELLDDLPGDAAEAGVLEAIKNGADTYSALCEELRAGRETVYAAVDSLADAGLIAKNTRCKPHRLRYLKAA